MSINMCQSTAHLKCFFNGRYVLFITLIRIIKMIAIIKTFDGLFTRCRNMSTNDHIMQSSWRIEKQKSIMKISSIHRREAPNTDVTEGRE